MLNISFQKRLIIGFTISLLLVFAVAYVAYTNSLQMQRGEKLVSRSREIIATASSVLNMVLDAETGQRGFVITGAQRFLKPYLVSIAQIDPEVQKLKSLIKNEGRHAQLTDSIEKYVHLKAEHLRDVIKVRETSGYEAAAAIISTDRGRIYTEKIRHYIAQILQRENALLKKREAYVESSSRDTQITIITGTILVLIIVAWLFFNILHTFKKQKLAEQKVIKANAILENYSLVVNNSADIIGTLDPADLSIIQINPAVENIIGYEPQECIGRPLYTFGHENSRENIKSQLEQLVQNKTSFIVFEEEIVTRKNDILTVECRASYKNNQLFINMNDITPRRQYQQQLQLARTEALNAKNAKELFLAQISHELRTPVSGMIGITNILDEHVHTTEEKRLVSLLRHNAKALLNIVNDVLDLSKINAGKLQLVETQTNIYDLLKALTEVMRIRAAETNLQLILKIDEKLPRLLYMDGLRLNQILMNLLSNALKFTEKGSVTLNAELVESAPGKVKVRFAVTDTGIGIPPEKQKLIFEAFQQADANTTHNYGGTGLGLSIVQELAKLKGGELGLKSQPGQGSTFSFINWYNVASEEIITENGQNSIYAGFEGMQVLIAEDNKINQMILLQILKKWNIAADVVDNGALALEKLKNKDYHLLILDTQMPVMDGFTTARAIRSAENNIPIISISAGAMQHEKEAAINTGMNAALEKPVDPQKLYSVISALTAAPYMNA